MEINGNRLTESLEDYLEVILELEQTNKVARVKDIAESLGIQRGSVTGALKNLSDKGFVNYEPYSFITLTPQGKTIAREIRRRHEVIRNFLENVLLLDNAQADENACRMEHAMDKAAIDRLVQFIDYIYQCPRTGEDWVQGFVNYYSRNALDPDQCRDCLKACLNRHREE